MHFHAMCLTQNRELPPNRPFSQILSHMNKLTVLHEGEVLASFDVVSLFTNVPVDLALAVARRQLQEDSALSDRMCLSVKEVMELREFCLSATFLGYRGMVYRQTFGTAMGSPVSVTVANLVMEDVEQRALATTDVHPGSGNGMLTTHAQYYQPTMCRGSWTI